MLPAVTYQGHGHTGVLQLNRPDNRNSMTPELLDAFALASAEARADTALRVDIRRCRQRAVCYALPVERHRHADLEGLAGCEVRVVEGHRVRETAARDAERRAVRNAAGVQSNLPFNYAFAAHKITIYII